MPAVRAFQQQAPGGANRFNWNGVFIATSFAASAFVGADRREDRLRDGIDLLEDLGTGQTRKKHSVKELL